MYFPYIKGGVRSCTENSSKIESQGFPSRIELYGITLLKFNRDYFNLISPIRWHVDPAELRWRTKISYNTGSVNVQHFNFKMSNLDQLQNWISECPTLKISSSEREQMNEGLKSEFRILSVWFPWNLLAADEIHFLSFSFWYFITRKWKLNPQTAIGKKTLRSTENFPINLD